MRKNGIPRRPVSIDNDELIDFLPVTRASAAKVAVYPALLQGAQTESAQKQQDASRVPVAVDPSLNAYTRRVAPRRRLGFGGTDANTLPSFTTATPAIKAEISGVADANCGGNSAEGGGHGVKSSTSKELLDAFWREDAAHQEMDLRRTRREAYENEIWAILHPGLAGSNVTADAGNRTNDDKPQGSLAYSVLDQFFADGVPDVEPWDLWALAMPRYGVANLAVAGLLDRVHHPVLPETHYLRHYFHREKERPVVVKLAKTREELRAERRERLRKAKEERDRAKRAARQKQTHDALRGGGALTTVTDSSSEKDRLTNNNIRLNLFGDSVLNPLGIENKIFSQYQERFLEHQRRNHDRHVAAIPYQIEKRNRDLKRHAEECPIFRAYRIYPIYSPSHLGKLRNFANDGLLRGFFLWVRSCDALVVLTGGEVAMRHLDRWILEKMRWESLETKATRLFTCPLKDAATFSFVSAKSRRRGRHLLDAEGEEEEETKGNAEDGKKNKKRGREDGGEHVYMNFVDSLQEGEQFLRTMPTDGPWKDLLHVWRAALAFGIENKNKH